MRKTINMVGMLAVLAIVYVSFNLTGCTFSSGGNDIDPAVSDSCDVCQMYVLPELVALESGDSVAYTAVFKNEHGEVIEFPPMVEWQSSSPNVEIDRYTGNAHVRLCLLDEAVITATAHDCEGNILTASARIRKPGPKLH